MTEERKARRRPRQVRSQATVDAILEATAQLLVEFGPTQATTNRIAERAGVSVGSLYQYFANKQAIYQAMGQRYVDQLRGALDRAFPLALQGSPEDAMRSMLDVMLASSRDDPTLAGLLHLTSLTSRAFQPVAEFEADFELRATWLLKGQAHRLADPPDDPSLAARILVRALGGIVGRTLTSEPELLSDPRFADAIVRLVFGFMGPLADPDADP